MTCRMIFVTERSSDFILRSLSFTHPLSPTQLWSTLRGQFPPLSMSLSSASSTLLRTCARQQLPATRAAVASCRQRRGVSDAKSTFDSPFGTSNEYSSTLKIPNFSKYSSSNPPRSNLVFSYFMAGSLGLASAVGAKATIQGTFSPSRPSRLRKMGK